MESVIAKRHREHRQKDAMSTTPPPAPRTTRGPLIEHIVQALVGLEFGTVEITVHHGRIVQIERREKVRLDIERQNRTDADTPGKSQN